MIRRRQYGNNVCIALAIILSSSLQISVTSGFSTSVCSSNTFPSGSRISRSGSSGSILHQQQSFMGHYTRNYNNVRGYRGALLASAADGEDKKKKKVTKRKKASKDKKATATKTKTATKKKKTGKAAATTKKATKRKTQKKSATEVVEMMKPGVDIIPAVAIIDEPAPVTTNIVATTPSTATKPKKKEEEYRYTGDDIVESPELDFDLTGGRPGSIIETEEQLIRKEEMLAELDVKANKGLLPDFYFDYGDPDEDVEGGGYDTDDPNAIDAETLGQWTIKDLNSKFEYEWTPESGDRDPNELEMDVTDQMGGLQFIKEIPVDEEGIDIGYDPIFGPSNPIDLRTKVGSVDSFMTDKLSKDESMLTPQFEKNDLEIKYNEDVVEFRKSLNILETYVDPFLPDDMEIPRHVAKWHGYPEVTSFPRKSFNNNRFTEKPTDFDAMTPHRARQYAVELARAKNAEWLPDGVSQAWHQSKRAIYDDPKYNTAVGSLRKDESTIDSDIIEQIQPALDVLGSVVDFLSIEGGDPETGGIGTVYRFYYHGLMRNKHGMSCWAETLIRDCGVDITNVVFETGFRKRDRLYCGGDSWWGPSFGPSHDEDNLN